jgi:hypothetical protein
MCDSLCVSVFWPPLLVPEVSVEVGGRLVVGGDGGGGFGGPGAGGFGAGGFGLGFAASFDSTLQIKHQRTGVQGGPGAALDGGRFVGVGKGKLIGFGRIRRRAGAGGRILR